MGTATKGKTMTHSQQTFNPIDYFFTWTDDWYTWDSKAAKKAALQARNAEVKRLRAEGYTVTTFTLSNQIVTRGGIGSGHPQIETVVSCYGFNASK